MINKKLAKQDLKTILNQPISVDFTLDGVKRKCHFNEATKIIFSDGASGVLKSILVLDEDNKDLKVKTIIFIEGVKYEITKCELESNVLKRCFLREI